MKLKTLILLFGVISSTLFSQEQANHQKNFYVSIKNASSLTIHKNRDGSISVLNKKDKKETTIYNSYKIFEFKLAYPNTDRDLLKNVYRVAVDNKELLTDLQKNYPDKYSRILEFFPAPNAYYPNDYGNTSPEKNLGNPYSSFDLDLINAPGAWSITKGDKKVVIGFSDSRIDTINSDMKGKIVKDIYNNKYHATSNCDHGTSVAGIAIARMDNAYGRPGICSECEGISARYGSFMFIEDLVEAGAKVINASWVSCSNGPKAQEVNERINEYYEDGIIIVAAAGNGNDCNGDKISVGDKVYPASFDKVISVSGVFAENKTIDDGYFYQDGINYTYRLADRRSGYFIIGEDGTLSPEPLDKGVQVNNAVDLVAPREGYLLGNDVCGKEVKFGGASSSAAPYVTGTIGLMWSVNYCLSSYEIESILKLTSADIENLNGNIPFKGKLGAGRIDAYKAVKMAKDMKDPEGNIIIEDRDFYRFDFKIERAQNKIIVQNQTFRENASVNFKARKAIVLKPSTYLKPNKSSSIKLAIDPQISSEECEPKPPKKYERIFK